MESPKYSVLMSLYVKEEPEHLKTAIQSMIDQTAVPDEILIVKDGPITEEQQMVLDYYSNAYPELFNIVGYEENKGLGFALNYGMERVRNELIARMDTDDIARPDRCQEQLQYFSEHPEVEILGGDIEEFIGEPSNAVGKRVVPSNNEDIAKYIKKRCPFNHMSVMYKKTAVQKAGGYQDWFWNEDYYLWLRMYLNGCKMANTGTILVDVRVGKEMYKRRGGLKYYKSEKRLQKFMLKNNIIGFGTYISNCAKRFIVQVLMPPCIRGFVFRKLARKKA